jgi:serine/threonine protein kinase
MQTTKAQDPRGTRVYAHRRRVRQPLPETSASSLLQNCSSSVSTLDALSLLIDEISTFARFPFSFGRVANVPGILLGQGRSFAAHRVDGFVIDGSLVLKRVQFTTEGFQKSKSEQEKARISLLEAMARELRILTHPPLQKHDNIISIFGVGWENDVLDEQYMWPVLVMEYGNRGNLRQYLQTPSEPIAFSDKISLCRDVARGLDALHECGIVHGDLKCSNVLVFADKNNTNPLQAKIADFGFSVLDSENETTLVGGTPPWTAPEWQGRHPISVLAQSDVYSLGLLVLQAMSDGADPFAKLEMANESCGSVASTRDIQRLKETNQILDLFEQQVKEICEAQSEEKDLICAVLRHSIQSSPEKRNISEILRLLGEVNELVSRRHQPAY